ncbi:MAG: Gfo/Idh/MocA family oxidoreductase, partial [Luteolibacter sp.]
MNSPTSIRWGFIGCGQIGIDKTLPGLLHAKHAHLVAISDLLAPRQALAIELAAQKGLQPKVYGDYHEILADPDVEAVYIALPTGMHKEAAIAAANAKKAVLCEKPMGNSAEEVREMVCAARDNGVPLMTAYMARFSDVFQKAKELIRGGAIGQVTCVT